MTSATGGATIAAVLREQMDDLEALLMPLSDEMCDTRRNGAWSIKETLSHIQGPEGDTFLDGIHRMIREDEPAIEVEPGLTHFNADRRHAPARALLSAVLSQYRSMADVLALAGTDTLDRRAHIALLARTPYGDRPTLAEWATVIADVHITGHIADLKTQVERTSTV